MNRYLNPAKYYRWIYEKIGPEPKVAFLHIPKTGGTYVVQDESGNLPVVWPIKWLGHVWVVKSNNGIGFSDSDPTILKNYLSKYTIFSIVRNPFSFLVSYAVHAGLYNNKYLNRSHYDYDIAQKGFDYLIRAIADREKPWPSKKFLFSQLFCDDGDLVADWILRNEFLDKELEIMSDKLNLRYKSRRKERVAAKANDKYKDFYNDSLRNLVYDTWGRELELFGYDFNGPTDKCILCGDIRNIKNKYKYFRNSNEFYY